MAYHEKMTFPNYLWIFDEIVSQEGNVSFTYLGMEYFCSEEDIIAALHGNIHPFLHAVQVRPNSPQLTSSGFSVAEIYDRYKKHTKVYSETFNVSSQYTFWASAIYDATWVLAFALNDTFRDLNTSITDIPLASKDFAEKLRQNMLQRKSLGISGDIEFDEAGFNIHGNTLDVYQYNGGRWEDIGQYTNNQLTLISNFSFNDKFSNHYEQIDVGVAVAIFVFTSVSLGLVVTAQIANIILCNNKVIKASSPTLNHLIFIGCYMIIAGIMLLTLESFEFPSFNVKKWFCNLVPILTNVGITLLIGTVCLKTWRLNRIYTKAQQCSREEIRCIKNYSLAGFVGILVAIDVVICIIWGIHDPLEPRKIEWIKIINDTPSLVIKEECESSFTLPYVITLSVPKVLLTLASFMLALSTHFKLQQLKTNNVVILTYLLTIIYGLAVPLYVIFLFVDPGITIRIALMCACFDVSICVSIIALFLPFFRCVAPDTTMEMIS